MCRFLLLMIFAAFLRPSFASANCEEAPQTAMQEHVLRFLEGVDRAGGGLDQMFHHALSDASTFDEIVWWEAFGQVLAVEEVLGHLKSRNYQQAAQSIASYSNSQLFSATSVGGVVSSAQSIAGLATLPIEMGLNRFVEEVGSDAFAQQVELYRLARSSPYNLSHQQILTQSTSHPDVLFDSSSGYLHTVGTQNRRTWVFRPIQNIERDHVYEFIRMAHESDALLASAEREKQRILDEFASYLDDFDGWTGPFIGGVWVGVATSGSYQFPYQWQIFQSGECVNGTISLANSSSSDWKTYTFVGEISDRELSFSGVGWVTSGNRPFCLATGTLQISGEGPGAVLAGNWGPNPVRGGCPPGSSGGVRLELQR